MLSLDFPENRPIDNTLLIFVDLMGNQRIKAALLTVVQPVQPFFVLVQLLNLILSTVKLFSTQYMQRASKIFVKERISVFGILAR